MRAGGAAALIVIGLMLLWVAASGKTTCLKDFGNCMATGNTDPTASVPGVPDTTNEGGGSWDQLAMLIASDQAAAAAAARNTKTPTVPPGGGAAGGPGGQQAQASRRSVKAFA